MTLTSTIAIAIPYDFDEIAELIGPYKPAEWLRLKEQSEKDRQEIAGRNLRDSRTGDVSREVRAAQKSLEERCYIEDEILATSFRQGSLG